MLRSALVLVFLDGGGGGCWLLLFWREGIEGGVVFVVGVGFVPLLGAVWHVAVVVPMAVTSWYVVGGLGLLVARDVWVLRDECFRLLL